MPPTPPRPTRPPTDPPAGAVRNYVVDPSAKATALGTMRVGLKNLVQGALRYPKISAFTFGGAIVYMLAQVNAAAVLGWATDNAMAASFTAGQAQWSAVGAAIALILGLALARLAGLIGRRVGSGFLGFELFAESRRRLADQYTGLPIGWHKRQNTGRLMAHVSSDAVSAWRVMMPFPFAVATLFMLVYAFWTIFHADVFLGIVGAVMFPLIIGVNLLYLNTLMPLVRAAQALGSDVTRTAHESFEAASVVKVLGREDYEVSRFSDSALRLRDATLKVDYVRAGFDPVLDSLPYVGVLVVMLVGGWRIESGAMSAATLVQVAYIFMIIGMPIRSFGWVLADLPRSVVGLSRLHNVWDARSEQSYGLASGGADGPAAVDLHRVHFEFKDAPEAIDAADAAVAQQAGAAPVPGTVASNPDATTTILRDFTFELSAEPGRNIVAVVGATGSGKSTLTQIVARLLDPQGGQVSLDQVPLDEFGPGEIAKDVVLVLQNAFIFDDTVRANLNLGETYPDDELWAALDIAQAKQFVAAFPEGLDHELGERGGSLSGGQRQRIALARALVRKPRLLILDDATSAVDPSVEAAILRGLRGAVDGMSLLMVAYRKATIALADDVVFMQDGRITARGTHSELLRDPEYAALVNAYDEAAIAHQMLETERAERDAEDRAVAEREKAYTGAFKSVAESMDTTEAFRGDDPYEPELDDEPHPTEPAAYPETAKQERP
ncbi:ABC transporter ATP-binding protein [Micrococcales bacterium 31B]|nr:ABC transporter ATP-binding protein [Micrococcales bacterium 31B]